MKILSKIITLSIVALVVFASTSTLQINTLASLNLHTNDRKISNIAVLLYSFDDSYMMQEKQSFEDIQKENKDKVLFTFYDGKNNIAVQEETFDSLLNSNIDLIILNLADRREEIVENFILRAKQKNIPLILTDIDPQVVSKVSKYYDKVVFISEDSKNAGTLEGKIIVDLWNTNKKSIDKNNDNILQYVLLEGEVNNPAAIDRTNYVISTINEAGIETQLLAKVNDNWLEKFAIDSVNSLFLKYNGKIEVIISNNDAMAIGAIKSLQKYGYNKGDKSKSIAVVGIDALPEAKDLIDKGFMTGTVVQNSKVRAEAEYAIGINLINNLNPIENTDYKIVNGEITIPFSYELYTGKTNIP
ncbi:galactose ABC transporter substrate-binding protein [Clostridium sp.]|uniref:galactose ABC transporter substrate-binding protein n=1 Tax=Clostridium sp. TaxID=1506 RepID=UPI00283EFCDB|nr:galactose ABC transporter substrate-binding protein [Clostridium sp.]MDR3596849.1 galactose ABC transporter substrate-binding protein [Clostridium sp.]